MKEIKSESDSAEIRGTYICLMIRYWHGAIGEKRIKYSIDGFTMILNILINIENITVVLVEKYKSLSVLFSFLFECLLGHLSVG